MKAFILDSRESWEKTKGLKKISVDDPHIDETNLKQDAEWVVVKLIFVGVCGSDRGIWFRTAFQDQIFKSLKRENKFLRIVGHELFGQIVEAGSAVKEKYGFKKGDLVSAESHITCGKCYQCVRGERHVCTDEIILGIGIDGCFAEYIKIPAKILWHTDTHKIRPEIACMQEPFGNAVHAATRVDLKGKRIAVFGCGPIGLMATMVARATGASYIIAADPNENKLALAKSFGADVTAVTARDPEPGYDAELVRKIHDLTEGVGVDVALEMAGYHTSVNTAIQTVRRGGDVVLFGIKTGDISIKMFDKLIVRGITLHSIIGRRIFGTWEITQRLLEDASNGIQDKLWNELLQGGKGTMLPFSEATTQTFEEHMLAHPKTILKF